MSKNMELSPKAIKEIEEVFQLRREALHILGLVVAEWKSDPRSVACFDLRVVKRAEEVVERLKKLDPLGHV